MIVISTILIVAVCIGMAVVIINFSDHDTAPTQPVISSTTPHPNIEDVEHTASLELDCNYVEKQIAENSGDVKQVWEKQHRYLFC